jgi:23S rRNA pseudouridine1911/1915/1917 synthase
MDPKEEADDSSHSSEPCLQITVDSAQAGLRLDQFLAQIIPSVSRALISAAIRDGHIRVDGLCRKSSHRLKERENISGCVEKPPPLRLTPEHIDFPVLFEDEFLMVLSKPPGLVVHPGSGNDRGTLVNGLLYHCQAIADVGDKLRPGIVHRLDKDTSGIILVAKQDSVHRALVDSFKNRRLIKEYRALLHGVLREKRGRLVAPIGRHPVNRQKMAINLVGGRHAVSNWEVLREFAGRYSLAKVTIETGRTHQIRVHMASLGCPVAGDRVYGPNRDNRSFPRQLLHASRLVFRHPVTDQLLDLTADIWPDFMTILENLDRQYGAEEQQ